MQALQTLLVSPQVKTICFGLFNIICSIPWSRFKIKFKSYMKRKINATECSFEQRKPFNGQIGLVAMLG